MMRMARIDSKTITKVSDSLVHFFFIYYLIKNHHIFYNIK